MDVQVFWIRPKKNIDMFPPLRVSKKHLTRAAGIPFFFVFFQGEKIESYIEQGTNKRWAKVDIGAMGRANLSVCGFDYFHFSCKQF